MLPIPLLGGILITLTLLMYGLGTVTLQRFKLATNAVLVFYTIASVLHFSSYIIIAKTRPELVFVFHGIMSFVAMLTLFVDTAWLWRCVIRNGKNSFIPNSLLYYSKIVFAYWVFTFFVAFISILFKEPNYV